MIVTELSISDDDGEDGQNGDRMRIIQSIEEIIIEHFKQEALQEGLQEGEKLGIEKGEKLGIEKGEKLGIEKGEKLGIEKGIRLSAEKMLQKGFEPAFVAEALSVELKTVLEVQQAIRKLPKK